jgi:DNA-binding XRE family transcriptional regulator
MLPFFDRRINVARKDLAPVWIAKEPTTLGQHLKNTRFTAGLRQEETALKLGGSARTFSLWECGRIVPGWAFSDV